MSGVLLRKKEIISNTNLCDLNSFSYRLARLTDEDFRRAEDFISLMKVLYMSTLCVSSEKTPHVDIYYPFSKSLKHIWPWKRETQCLYPTLKTGLGKPIRRYQNDEIKNFLQVATALDPRFKHKLDDDTVWDQIQRKLIDQSTEEDWSWCGHHPVWEWGRGGGWLHWRSCLLRRRQRT